MSKYKSAYAAKGVVLLVKKPVEKIWKRHRQTSQSAPESCGILMAKIDSDSSRIWLQEVTIPTKSDRRSRFSFHLRGEKHERQLRKIATNSGGTIRLLGTWHTHPEDDPSPSKADLDGWAKLRAANPQFREFCFAIVGLETTAIFLSVGESLALMNPINLKSKNER